MTKAIAAAALSALLLAVVPAAADAKTFRGKTNQKLAASVVTGADGVPTRVRIAYRAPCRERDQGVTGATKFQSPLKSASVDAAQDGGTETVKSGSRAGETARVTTTMTAQRAGERWTGTYSVRLVVRYHGRTIDTCQVKRITWSAKAT